MSKKNLIKIIIIFSIIYIFLQLIIYFLNDTNISRFFWIEHKNIKELIDTGLPEQSKFKPFIKFISDKHFWLLRTGVIITLILAIYYKNKNKKIYYFCMNIFISVILVLIISSGLITWILKIGIGKPRPSANLDFYLPFSLSTRFHSFPSGHTTETFSYIIPFIYFIKKYYVYIFLLAYGILTAFTRIILAYHYFSDVLFGIYITSVIGFIICYIVENSKKKI